jgi:hypothetical protein
MSNIDFKALGKTLALSELGVPLQEQNYFTDFEGDSSERARLAINFCKEASSVMPYLGEGGEFASILLSKVASSDPNDLDSSVVDAILDAAFELNELTKSSGAGAAALTGAAGAATTYIPTLLKSFLALAALGGATGGAALWAGRKALQGPDEDEIAKLEAGIKEYHKLRGRVQREQANKQIEDEYL